MKTLDILTQEDLINITGGRYATKQIKYLREHNIPFLIGSDGKPKVARQYIEKILGLSISLTKERRREPNFKNL
ncbi:MAG: hypothetical protein A3E87_01825 [Gammaproteobacteria bacterium RIFCSPHIGHO2_12_FULL_35_23]|nr:MAG: hypothetical protein A3E87_01825 [Gammaproteobacteria bacterium RIFCSPHIGHO2_12_FULL_35_23]